MKKALIVIDVQNDYLYEKRMKQFAYDTENVTENINSIIDEYSNNGNDIIYIKHIIQNIWTNRLIFGYSIAGTEGAEIYSGIKIVSDNCFEKLLPDAFSNKQFKKFVMDNGYDTLALIGLDECGCVGATAKGTVKNGLKAELISRGVFSVFPDKKIQKMRDSLEKIGVRYI